MSCQLLSLIAPPRALRQLEAGETPRVTNMELFLTWSKSLPSFSFPTIYLNMRVG